jgi:hypothetical protein
MGCLSRRQQTRCGARFSRDGERIRDFRAAWETLVIDSSKEIWCRRRESNPHGG